MPAPTPSRALTTAGSDHAVSADTFRGLFRGHPAGVVVVTTGRPSDTPVGFTATSLTSVSLDPPLLSVALAATSSSWPALQREEGFVVNFLSSEHRDLAARFATRGIDRFAPPTRWSRLGSGEPRLDDAHAWARCQTTDRIAVGDHHMVLGLVVDSDITASGNPLLYHDGDYRELAPQQSMSNRAAAS